MYQAFVEGEIAVITEPAKTFSRMFRGYDPAAVDAYIEVLTTKQQLLLDDVESLRARLMETGDEAAARAHPVLITWSNGTTTLAYGEFFRSWYADSRVAGTASRSRYTAISCSRILIRC